MLPNLIIQIALIVIVIRCGYKAVLLFQHRSKAWLEIAFYISVALVALNFLF